MKADAARFACSFVIVLCVVGIVLAAASGCKSFEAYLSAVLVIIFAAFVARTQPC